MNIEKKTTSLQKCHFRYKSLKFLRYHISKLNIIIQKKKITTVIILLFSNKFKYLESNFKLFNYYHNFIFFFTILIKFFFKLKILLLKNISSQNRLRKIYISTKKIIKKNSNLLDIVKNIWKLFKRKLCFILIFHYLNFFKFFILYTDGSKK